MWQGLIRLREKRLRRANSREEHLQGLKPDVDFFCFIGMTEVMHPPKKLLSVGSIEGTVPTGLAVLPGYEFPTLKRGANKHCAYGALHPTAGGQGRWKKQECKINKARGIQ